MFTEAAAVTPEGRISPQDLGVWSEKHFEPLERIARFIDGQGARAGIQLAHAGRKGKHLSARSREMAPFPESSGGWRPLAPSAVAFNDAYPMPAEMTVDQIHAVQDAFAVAAGRAFAAGFQVIEIHGAHGYLIHEFLSPFSNRRVDAYGGSFDNRTRFVRESVAAVRRASAGALRAVCADLGDRLGGGRMGHRPIGRASAPVACSRRRCDRLLVGRQC